MLLRNKIHQGSTQGLAYNVLNKRLLNVKMRASLKSRDQQLLLLSKEQPAVYHFQISWEKGLGGPPL